MIIIIIITRYIEYVTFAFSSYFVQKREREREREREKMGNGRTKEKALTLFITHTSE